MSEMRGWLRVPDGGLSVDGVQWLEGPLELKDSSWYNILKQRGAEVIDEETYDRLLRERRAAEKLAKAAKSLTAARKTDAADHGSSNQEPPSTSSSRRSAGRRSRRVPAGS